MCNSKFSIKSYQSRRYWKMTSFSLWDIVSNVSTLCSVLVEAWFSGAVATLAFCMQCNTYPMSSTIYECIRSCTHVQLTSDPKNCLALTFNSWVAQKLFRHCLQLVSDLIKLFSDSRVTHLKQWYAYAKLVSGTRNLSRNSHTHV